MSGRVFSLSVRCQGAAFEDTPEPEVARLLRAAADRVEQGTTDGAPLLDANGNTVGAWVWVVA